MSPRSSPPSKSCQAPQPRSSTSTPAGLSQHCPPSFFPAFHCLASNLRSSFPCVSPLPCPFLMSSSPCFPSPPSALPSESSFLYTPTPPHSRCPLPLCLPLSLTSLSCSITLSAWIFLTCSKHLSRKLWGR